MLFTLARLDRAATGRDVYLELVEVTGRDASVAAVHVTLGRLEDKGLVAIRMGDGAEGLGRQVRHFALREPGMQALRDSRTHWERLWNGIALEPGDGA
ncbi:MAG: PadR family transcriptional regulator [Acidobacteria bacterium]|nr:PadR family transcriptional regulator [Acidobacteriota bacterium]